MQGCKPIVAIEFLHNDHRELKACLSKVPAEVVVVRSQNLALSALGNRGNRLLQAWMEVFNQNSP